MEYLKFEDLPKAVHQITEQLTRLEELVASKLSGSPAETEEQFMTVEQAAQYLHLSVQTLYGKVCRRTIPFMKRSKRLYFSRDELKSYLKDGSVLTTIDYKNAVDELPLGVGRKSGRRNNRKGI